MTRKRDRNVFGAFALLVTDEIERVAAAASPEPGPAASALALLGHVPGLSIVTLASAIGLSHAGCVRLVDRLAMEGLIERRQHPNDARTKSLYLTESGAEACAAVLEARDRVLSRFLGILSPSESAALGTLSEKLLRNGLRSEQHAYEVCRLCDYPNCTNCPVDDELRCRPQASIG